MRLSKFLSFSALLTCTLLMTPRSLFAESKIEELNFKDSALTRCVQEWSKDPINAYKNTSEVQEIACAGYGISELEGIEQLPELLVIDLSNNPIRDYSPLLALKNRLGFLWIWGNQLSCNDFLILRRQLPRTWVGGFDIDSCNLENPNHTSNVER